MNETELIAKIGYPFADMRLLETALNHASYANEHGMSKFDSNERLEFLGDAVLENVISDYLYKRLPNEEEGALTRLRAHIVCERSLFRIANTFSLGGFLNLGKGEEHGGRDRASIVSDALEALIGAIYLDGGAEAARRFIMDEFGDVINEAVSGSSGGDYKTALQERLQSEGQVNIRYLVDNQEGPEHDKVFYVSVLKNGKRIGRGSGRNKKQAEQDAARNALGL